MTRAMTLRDEVAARLKKLMAVSDDADVIAEAILPLVIERCATTVERRERPREDHCCSAVYADCAAAIRKLKDPTDDQ